MTKNISTPAEILRNKAEELAKKKPSKSENKLSEVEIMKLIHELEVHQIELEMQNEELLLAKTNALQAAEKYSELYDFAPTGYFTLNNDGIILELNLHGSQMLAKVRIYLTNFQFGYFVTEETKPLFYNFLQKAFSTATKETCELTLLTNENKLINVILTGIVPEKSEECNVAVFDITERKQAEEALRESEARYRLLFETSVDGILMVDVETMTFKYANPAICSMLGYSEEELTTLGLQDIHPKQHLKRVLDEFKSQSHGDKTLALDIPCLRKDGSIVYADINTTTISIDGRTMAVGHFRDITERKQTEEALAHEQSLMNALMTNLPDYIYFKDKESRFIKISEAHAKSFKLKSAEEAIGKTDFDFFSEEHAQQAYEDEQEIIRTGKLFTKVEKETWPNRPDTWVSTIKFPFMNQDGIVLGIFGMSWDITERMKTEEALRKSEEKYRRITENISDIVWASDMQFNIQYISPSAEKMMRMPIEEYISQPFDEKFTPQSIEKIYALFAQEKEKEKNPNCDKNRTMKIEVEHYRGDGTTFWSEMHILFIRDENGKTIGLEGVTRDISERKQAEEELNDKIDELMHFHRLTVGRELAMIELKKEVNLLLKDAGKQAKYNIVG